MNTERQYQSHNHIVTSHIDTLADETQALVDFYPYRRLGGQDPGTSGFLSI